MFKDSNLKFLDDMENKLLNIKCGFNIKKIFRIRRYIKSISIVRNNIIKSDSDIPSLVDRWFMDSLFLLVCNEGGFKLNDYFL